MYKINFIRWTRGSIEHIARHNITPAEVEEALFDNEPLVRKGGRDRAYVLARTIAGRYLFIVISYPPRKGIVNIITAREMEEDERRLYKKR